MSSRSLFLVNVGDLTRGGARSRRVEIEAPVDWSIELSKILVELPLSCSLDLTHTSVGLVVRGTVRFAAEHMCHRCLTDHRREVNVALTQLYARRGAVEGSDYELTDDEVDLEPMIRDEVLLAMPLLPVCGEACPGLVDVPESDLNTGAPGADGDESSPFGVLRNMFGTGK